MLLKDLLKVIFLIFGINYDLEKNLAETMTPCLDMTLNCFDKVGKKAEGVIRVTKKAKDYN